MQINLEKLFNELDAEFVGSQKKVLIDSSLKIYYGKTIEGYYRLSFMSTVLPPTIQSTKDILVSQGQESDDVYWTCFDLINQHAKHVFYSFCQDLILSVTNKYDEGIALFDLKNRYSAWISLFKSKKKMSAKTIQGLFGELVFLKNFMLKNFSQEQAVDAWSGPDGYSKDYAINNEWFEIKTTGANSNIVNISSIAQLSSKTKGNLVVVKVEKMSEVFDDGQSTVLQVFNDIMLQIKDNELKAKLIQKLLNYGFDVNDNENNERFRIDSISIYEVGEDFPRILEDDIKYQEIRNVSYEIVLSAIEKFRKEKI